MRKSMYVSSVCTAEGHNRWLQSMHRRGRKCWCAPAHRITSRWLLSMHRRGRGWWCAPAHRITRRITSRWLLLSMHRRGRGWWCAPAHRITRRWLLSTHRRGRQWWCAPAHHNKLRVTIHAPAWTKVVVCVRVRRHTIRNYLRRVSSPYAGFS